MYRHSYPISVCLLFASLVISACALVSTPLPSPTTVPSRTPLPSTFTPEATATQTPRPSSTPKPTRTPNFEATAQYDAVAAKVKEYFDAGYISTSKGVAFRHLPLFTDHWAQIDWFQWTYLDYSPADFVIETDLKWESASAVANSSGCGFVFRLADKDNFYVMFVSLKGYVESTIFSGGNSAFLSRGYYGSAAQNGGVHLTLIVEGDTFRVLIDDKFIKSYTGFKAKLLSGKLAYTVFSGTNKDYGTRCTFSNTDLWTIKK
jgi:hypothetical protein